MEKRARHARIAVLLVACMVSCLLTCLPARAWARALPDFRDGALSVSARPSGQASALQMRLRALSDEGTLVDPNAELKDSGAFGESDALTWEYYDDATLKIYGAGPMPDFEETTQPWNRWLTSIEHIEVCEGITTIGDHAFHNAWIVNKVRLPATTLTRIGAWAFCHNDLLQAFDMPDSVKEIGEHIFDASSSFVYRGGVRVCHLSTSLSSVPAYAFCESGLTTVNYPEGLTSIGASAFYACSDLMAVSLPQTLTEVCDGAFALNQVGTVNSAHLDSLVVPGSVTSMGTYAFLGVDIRGDFTFGEGIREIASRRLTSMSCQRLSIPSTVEAIDDDAFSEVSLSGFMVSEGNESYASVDGVLCSRALHPNGSGELQSYESKQAVLFAYPNNQEGDKISIPEGVIDINQTALYSLYWNPSFHQSLTLHVPSTLARNLESSTARDLSNLAGITVAAGNEAYASRDGVLFSADMKELLFCPAAAIQGSYTMPVTVETIRPRAFERCADMTEVIVSPKVSSLPVSCFLRCVNLVNLYLPASVERIGYGAFLLNVFAFDDGAIENVYYGGSSADWERLKTSALTESGGNDLLGGHDVNVRCDVAHYGACDDGLAYLIDGDGVMTVRVDSAIEGEAKRAMGDYADADSPWHPYGSEIRHVIVSEGVTSVGRDAFRGCSALEQVTVLADVTSIAADAFRGCALLTDVVFAGDAPTVATATSEEASFDAQRVALHYVKGNQTWETDVFHDEPANTWAGYRVADDALSWLPTQTLPMLASVSLEADGVHVAGGFERQWESYPLRITILSDEGDDISDEVSVTIVPPERQAPLTWLAQWLSSASEGDKTSAYYGVVNALYDQSERSVIVGRCALAGSYEVIVTPVAGKATGDAISKSFTVTRDPEVIESVTVYSYGVTGRRAAEEVKSKDDLSVGTQYGEEILGRCTWTFADVIGDRDVTDRTRDHGFWMENGIFHVSEMAPSGQYSAEVTDGLTGQRYERQLSFAITRDTNVMNVPYSLALSGGENRVEVGEDDFWVGTRYVTRVLDAFDDPCWPDITWTVADAVGTDVSRFFDVDLDGYLFVRASVRDILSEGDNDFVVTASAWDSYSGEWRSDSVSLTLAKAPAYVPPATHMATFRAGETVVAEVAFTKGDETLEEPAVPARDNYLGSWSDYDLAAATGDITIEARYVPIDADAVVEVEPTAIASYENGAIAVSLSATAAGSTVRVASETTKPVDVVLVLDQSGSMAESLGTTGTTKRDALAACANAFVGQLRDNAVATGADHRVALVGFAYSAYRNQSSASNRAGYVNTGLLATATGGFKGFASLTTADYASALLPVGVDGTVNPAVTAGIGSIVAEGATAADIGLKMAKNIFAANPVATGEGGPERERVVIFITDGVPTSWGTSPATLVTSTAADAVAMAQAIKQGQGARIYSVGVDADADPSAAFTPVADGLTTDRFGSYLSYDFNRFLHAISSNFPDAAGVGSLGEGDVAAGYYLAVNDTSSLARIFTTILYGTVYEVRSFDRATLSYTLPAGLALTMSQEESLRADLVGRGMSDDDITVITHEDGSTTLGFANVPVAIEYDADGVERHVAHVSFAVSAERGVAGTVPAAVGASVSYAGSAAEGLDKLPEVSVPVERCLVVFKMNDAVYEIRELGMGDSIVAPDTQLARWGTLEEMDDPRVVGSYAVFETTTLTRSYNIRWKAEGHDLLTTLEPGASVEVPAEVAGWVPEGMELIGWSPMLPATMPARNICCTAVLAPAHTHDFSFATTYSGNCNEGVVTHHVCVCGAEQTSRAEPKEHRYEAVLSSNGEYGTTVEQLVCADCGHAIDKHVTYVVARNSLWRTTYLDLSSYTGEVLHDGASDDDISLRFFVGNEKGGSYRVTRIDADGKKTAYDCAVRNGWLTFDPDHFSYYTLTDVSDAQGLAEAEALTYDGVVEAFDNATLPEVAGEPEGLVQGAKSSGTIGTCRWELAGDGTLTIRPADGETAGDLYPQWFNDDGGWLWRDLLDVDRVTAIRFGGTVRLWMRAYGLFHAYAADGHQSFANLRSVDLSCLDTSQVSDFSTMFAECYSLVMADLSSLDTSAATTLDYLFEDCRSLGSVNLSGIDTSKVTSMMGLFRRCEALESVDMSGLDMSGVTTLADMFDDCSTLVSVTFGAMTRYTGTPAIIALPGQPTRLNNLALPAGTWSDGTRSLITAELAALEPPALAGTWTRRQGAVPLFGNPDVEATTPAGPFALGELPDVPDLLTIRVRQEDGSWVRLERNTHYAVGEPYLRESDGRYCMDVSGIEASGYTGRASFILDVVDRISLDDADVYLADDVYEGQVFLSTGEPIRPAVSSVYVRIEVPGADGGGSVRQRLLSPADYAVSYGENLVGVGTVTVSPKEGSTALEGSRTLSFTVIDRNSLVLGASRDDGIGFDVNLSATWRGGDAGYVVPLPAQGGAEPRAFVGITRADGEPYVWSGELVEGRDFVVSYADNDRPGAASATIRGINGITGTMEIGFEVAGAPIDVATLGLNANSFEQYDYPYTGEAVEPRLNHIWEERLGGACELSYRDNVEPGTCKITVRGVEPRYTGEVTLELPIVRADGYLALEDCRLEVADVGYDGSWQEPPVRLLRPDGTEVDPSRYTVGYSANRDAGTATAYATARGAWAFDADTGTWAHGYTLGVRGTARATFEIAPADIAQAVAAVVGEQVGTGGRLTPKVSASWRGLPLAEGRDYGLEYGENVSGTGTVTLVGAGNYAGSSKVLEFAIADYAPGDVDGDGLVDLRDVVYVRRHIAGGYAQDINVAAADVDDSLEVDLLDVLLIRRHVAGGWGVTLRRSRLRRDGAPGEAATAGPPSVPALAARRLTPAA